MFVAEEGYEYDPYGKVTVFQPATASGYVTFTSSDAMEGTMTNESTIIGARYGSLLLLPTVNKALGVNC